MDFFITTIFTEQWKEHYDRVVNKGDNEVWVTDLVQCSLKSEFTKEFPFMMGFSPGLLVGDIIHVGLEKIIVNLFKDRNIKVEVDVSKEFEGYVIKGRVDIMTEDEIIDIKYMRAIGGELPLEHHVNQVKIYMWITGYRKGRLIYVTPDGFKEYSIDVGFSDMDIRRLLSMDRKPLYDWECKYCQFNQICPFSSKHQKTQSKRNIQRNTQSRLSIEPVSLES